MKPINILIIICLTCIIIGCKEKEKHCTIKGKIINRDSKVLILRKACLDFRTDDTVRIPIFNNTFSFEFSYIVPEAYSLIFEEELIPWAYKEIIFFPVDGEIKMELFDLSNSSKNRIEGSEFTTQYYNLVTYFKKLYNPPELLEDSISILQKNDVYYSDTMKILKKKMDEIGTMRKESRKIYNQIAKLEETGHAYTPSANQIIKQLNEFKINVKNEMYNYMEQQPDIVSYYMLIDEMKRYKSYKKL